MDSLNSAGRIIGSFAQASQSHQMFETITKVHFGHSPGGLLFKEAAMLIVCSTAELWTDLLDDIEESLTTP